MSQLGFEWFQFLSKISHICNENQGPLLHICQIRFVQPPGRSEMLEAPKKLLNENFSKFEISAETEVINFISKFGEFLSKS